LDRLSSLRVYACVWLHVFRVLYRLTVRCAFAFAGKSARAHTEIRQVTHSEEGRRLVTFRRVVQMLPISKQSAHERGLQLNTPIHFYYIDSSDCPPPTLVASACCGVIGAAGACS